MPDKAAFILPSGVLAHRRSAQVGTKTALWANHRQPLTADKEAGYIKCDQRIHLFIKDEALE